MSNSIRRILRLVSLVVVETSRPEALESQLLQRGGRIIRPCKSPHAAYRYESVFNAGMLHHEANPLIAFGV